MFVVGRHQGLPYKPVSVIPVGDSIVTGSAGQDAYGMQALGTTYADLAILQAGITHIRNAGVGGETSTAILARFDADVIQYRPSIALIQCGTNDLTGTITNATYATLMNNLEEMVQRCRKSGILPVLGTPPPKNSANTETTMVQWWYYELARHYGIPLIDTYRYLVDPANGNYASGLSSDSVHPYPAGVQLLASQAATILSTLPACGPYFAASAVTAGGDQRNLVPNGNFTYNTNFGFWTTTASGSTRTAETPDSTFWPGYTAKIVRDTAAQGLLLSNSTITGWSVGEVLEFSGRVKISGLTPATATGMTISLTGGGTTWNVRPALLVPNNGTYIWSMRTAAIPAGTTTMSITSLSNDAGTYEFDNITLINVTRRSAIWQPGQKG